jgi:hypothetical protein
MSLIFLGFSIAVSFRSDFNVVFPEFRGITGSSTLILLSAPFRWNNIS